MADIKLEKISVYGFKSIRALEDFEIRPLNVLIGANGAGKSNFIELFQLLKVMYKQRLGRYSIKLGLERLLYYGQKETEKISLRLDYNSPNVGDIRFCKFELIPALDGTLKVAYEELDYNGIATRSVRGYSNSDETVFFVEEILTFENQFFPTWEIYHFHDTSSTAKMKGRQDLHDNRRLAPDAQNLAPYLYYLQQKHPEYYQRIVQAVQRVAPFFDDFVLEPLRLAKEEIRLEWRDKNNPETLFTAHELSDGTLRFICLATLLLQPELPNLILVDEPELGLHPFAINLLVDMLEIASQNTQLIVSTQSVSLVNQLKPEQVVVVNRKDGQSTFERLDVKALEAWLEEYGLGELWEKNVLGGRPQREPQV
jgi:predicted ATPase